MAIKTIKILFFILLFSNMFSSGASKTDFTSQNNSRLGLTVIASWSVWVGYRLIQNINKKLDFSNLGNCALFKKQPDPLTKQPSLEERLASIRERKQKFEQDTNRFSLLKQFGFKSLLAIFER